ncbi:MAG: hypothetical protein CMI55_04170 [Parcubacteria group bacterium]|jgi:broad specificity phosphatase PhoE|nr:hypothetical protein [Parcubacteria group bacterium]|tara:strand:+ start:1030 stop:1692 length:663 start_codon:yes stop_codon:yes gene_type:complete
MIKKTAIKTIYFVRHGESEGNTKPVFQSLDSPLTSKGRKQAQYIAERASHLSFEAIIASPLSRAKETAEIITKKVKKSLEFSDLFIERIKPTETMGRPYTDEKAKQLYMEWMKSLFTPGFRAKDGENFNDIITRAKRALEYLSKRSEKELLVVTHGFFLRTMVAIVVLGDTISDKSFKQFQERVGMENTGLTILILDDNDDNIDGLSWRLWVWNDYAHLG